MVSLKPFRKTICRFLVCGALVAGLVVVLYAQEPDSGTTDLRLTGGRARSAAPAATQISSDLKERIEQDPIQAGRENAMVITALESRVLVSVKQFEQRVKRLKLDRIGDQRIALAEIRKLLDELEQSADTILDGYSNYRTSLGPYLDVVGQAPIVFEAIAKSFEMKAADKENEDLAGSYLDFAKLQHRLADRYRIKGTELRKERDRTEVLVRFVRRSKVFIQELRDALQAIPTPDEAEAVETYARRVNLYLEEFEKVIHAVKDVAGKIADPSESRSSGGN